MRTGIRLLPRPALGLAAVVAACALVAGAAGAAFDADAARKQSSSRIAEIRAQVAELDVRLRAPGLSRPAFAALQDLRTSLAQERKLLEERERVMERVANSVVPPATGAASSTTAVTPSTAPARTLGESGGWARFEGSLPCAGCDGIHTELTLYSDGLRYALRERASGPNAPRRTFESEGLWRTLRGHGGDPNATVFELDYDKPDRARHFLRLSDHEIKLIDLDENKLRKKHNLILKRVAP